MQSLQEMAFENESFEDTVVDVINYMVLFYAYIKDKKTDMVNPSTQIYTQEFLNQDIQEFNKRPCCRSKSA